MDLLSIINSSLEFGYCSTMLSNHNIIRLVRFVSKVKVGVVKWVFVINPYLILLIGVWKLMCRVVDEIFGELNRATSTKRSHVRFSLGTNSCGIFRIYC
jgi:hypothetical protein